MVSSPAVTVHFSEDGVFFTVCGGSCGSLLGCQNGQEATRRCYNTLLVQVLPNYHYYQRGYYFIITIGVQTIIAIGVATITNFTKGVVIITSLVG